MQNKSLHLCDSASVLAQKKQYVAAFDCYKKAIMLDGDNYLIHFNYGLALYSAGNWSDAVSELKIALQLHPDDDDTADTLALALQKSGDQSAAENVFVQLLNRNPFLGRGWNNLGVLYFELARYESAKECFERALACVPSDRDARYNLRDVNELLQNKRNTN